MKDIIEEIDSRIKSPLFGYFFILLLAFNWEEMFYLTADKSSVTERIAHFHNGTDIYSLFIYPFIFSVIYAVIYPWLNYRLMCFVAKPTDLKNNLQAKSEHKILTEKNRLEQLRSESLAISEQSIIEQAKRDQQVEKIEDEELKENVKSSIQAIREESTDPYKIDDPEKLLKIADSYRERAKNSNSITDINTWRSRAEALEDKAHKIISGSIDSP